MRDLIIEVSNVNGDEVSIEVYARNPATAHKRSVMSEIIVAPGDFVISGEKLERAIAG